MIWLIVALVVVAAAASLLIWILLEARGIGQQAKRALTAAAEVERNTQGLWAIPQVNQLLKEGDHSVAAIVGKSGTIADAVAPPGRGAT